MASTQCQREILNKIYANLSIHKLEDVVEIVLKGDEIVLKSFKYNTKVSYFYIPEGVTTLLSSCFSGTDLAIIKIPPTVTKVGYACFANCANLHTIKAPVSLMSEVESLRYGNNSEIIFY